MNSKGHLFFSLIKSVMRMFGFIFLFKDNMMIAVVLLVLAELLGVLEEFTDER